jgi:ATP synthase F1 delta subunit
VFSGSLQVLFTSLPGRYAHALFTSGVRFECLDGISNDFKKLEELCGRGERARKLLAGCLSNSRSRDEYLKVIEEHLSFCQVFSSFMKQLLANKRYGLLGKIRYIYEAALLKHKGTCNAVISSSIPLSLPQKRAIKSIVTKISDKKVSMKYVVDKKILGGVKVAIGWLVLDMSILSQVKQVTAHMMQTIIGREVL